MADFTRGTTIQIDTQVTAGTLHTLIESALVSGISVSDLAVGLYSISVGAATPNPSMFPFWFNPDQEDPAFRVFAAPWNIWLTVGPDRFEVPLQNASATLCAKGCLVCASNSSQFYIATSPSINAIGFLQATTASGAYGPIALCGIGYSMYSSSASTASTQPPGSSSGIKSYGCPAGGVHGQGLGTNGGSGPFHGLWLESQRSGASGTNQAYRTLIWGTKLTV